MHPVAVISSPNTTSTFQVDILEEYIGAPLEGMIVYFDVEERSAGLEKQKKRVVCQLFGMQGSNRWHEDPIMKAVIKKQGALKFLSGDSDTKSASLKIMGVFTLGNTVARTMLNTPPTSGTSVYVADEKVIAGLVQSDKGVFYPGVIYASDTPAPAYLRHFGKVDEGGNGEAMLIGTFGQSGYGKSVISATLIAGFACNKQMGLFIIDPAGEFAGDKFGRDSNLDFQFHRLLRLAGRTPHVLTVKKVALESPYPFAELLGREKFFDNMGFKTSEKQEQARARIIDYLEDVKANLDQLGQSPANVLDTTLLRQAWVIADSGQTPLADDSQQAEIPVGLTSVILDLAAAANFIYARTNPKRPREKEAGMIEKILNDPILQKKLSKSWQKAADYYDTQGRQKLTEVIKSVLENNQIVILDLHEEGEQPYFVINEILGRLKHVFKSRFVNDRKANALIVLDEAHYYAPQDPGDNPDKNWTARYLKEIAKISRKYGVGWFFINQRISDFDKDVFSQLHVRIFAQGLAIGADEVNMVSIVGRDAFNRYADLPDAKMTGVFPFMLQGPIVALGTGQSPIIIQGFPSTQAIINHNKHLYSTSEMPPSQRITLMRGNSEQGID